MTHTLINPQVDRSKPVEQQDKDLAAKIVKETDAGIVISGARMVSTLCAYSHDLLVMPSTYLANNEEAKPYAFGFAMPVNAPGLRFICRPSVIHLDAGSPMDYPLSARLDETDAMVVFDNVLVPWERVFIHRDAEMCNGLYNRTGAMPQIMHQFSTKNLSKAEFMMALAFAIARSTKIDAHLHVQGMLAEMIQFTEFVRACLRASEADAKPNAAGFMTPAAMPLWTVRMMFPKMFIRMCEIIQTLGAGGLVAVPSYAELDGPIAADVETYFQAANADSRYRIKLFRLAFDAAVSSFSGRQQLYERYYSGDPVRLAGDALRHLRQEHLCGPHRRAARRPGRAAERSQESDEVPAASCGRRRSNRRIQVRVPRRGQMDRQATALVRSPSSPAGLGTIFPPFSRPSLRACSPGRQAAHPRRSAARRCSATATSARSTSIRSRPLRCRGRCSPRASRCTRRRARPWHGRWSSARSNGSDSFIPRHWPGFPAPCRCRARRSDFPSAR